MYMYLYKNIYVYIIPWWRRVLFGGDGRARVSSRKGSGNRGCPLVALSYQIWDQMERRAFAFKNRAFF